MSFLNIDRTLWIASIWTDRVYTLATHILIYPINRYYRALIRFSRYNIDINTSSVCCDVENIVAIGFQHIFKPVAGGLLYDTRKCNFAGHIYAGVREPEGGVFKSLFSGVHSK